MFWALWGERFILLLTTCSLDESFSTWLNVESFSAIFSLSSSITSFKSSKSRDKSCEFSELLLKKYEVELYFIMRINLKKVKKMNFDKLMSFYLWIKY